MLICHPLVNIRLVLAMLAGLTRPLWEVLSSFTGVKSQQGATGHVQQSTHQSTQGASSSPHLTLCYLIYLKAAWEISLANTFPQTIPLSHSAER